MTDTPEMDRLTERLFGEGRPRVRSFNVLWGPKARLLTTEERAAAINKALDAPGKTVTDLDRYIPVLDIDA